ncbi:MAG: hypothetical protein A2103_03440 [Gammaproteobacteria bacterium GWF2_41_13]|nr:MAG: hypothetical protein A2103_03440 [Gammaproteobacteria bacterium GWF2_41_13]
MPPWGIVFIIAFHYFGRKRMGVIRAIESGKRVVNRLLLLQVALSFAMAISVFFCDNIHAADAIFLGGLIGLPANFYFARKFFVFTGARQATAWMKTIYLAEAKKIVINVVLLLIVIKWVSSIELMPFLMGFVAMQFLQGFAPLLLKVD